MTVRLTSLLRKGTKSSAINRCLQRQTWYPGLSVSHHDCQFCLVSTSERLSEDMEGAESTIGNDLEDPWGESCEELQPL